MVISFNKLIKDDVIIMITVCNTSTEVIPARSNITTIIALLNERTPNIISLKVAAGTATLKFNKTEQLVNSSFCHIASLEVFRGRNQAIEIDHSGFLLSDNGTIEVRQRKINWSQIMHTHCRLIRMN